MVSRASPCEGMADREPLTVDLDDLIVAADAVVLGTVSQTATGFTVDADAGRCAATAADSSGEKCGTTSLHYYLKAHPVSDAALRKEYDTIKGQIGDKEYKARHVLVETEAEAQSIIDKLNKEINAGLVDPKVKARLANMGSTALPGSPADFGKLIAEETEKWAKVRAANIKPE